MVSLIATGCGADTISTLTDVEDAELCLNDASGLRVVANYGDCLAGGCTSVEDTRCQVTVSGNVVSLSTQATLLDTNESDCPANCLSVLVACEPVDLPAGGYEVRYADRTHTVTLPLTPVAPLAGEEPNEVCYQTLMRE